MSAAVSDSPPQVGPETQEIHADASAADPVGADDGDAARPLGALLALVTFVGLSLGLGWVAYR
jgi:hypothetical protein